jgi:hypothetical protein
VAGAWAAWGVALTLAGGCIGAPSAGDSGRPSSERRRYPLNTLPTANVSIGEHTFHVWLAGTPEQQQEGLMYVTDGEIADDQGMLFVFPDEQERGFWMLNTITSLDIAFARMDGTIVKTHTMPPQTLRTFPSVEPAMFALEVKAGTFERLGITEGDVLVIPAEALNP